MFAKLIISLIFLSNLTFAQSTKCESDTTINKIEFLKLKQMISECDDEMKQSLTQIKALEISIDVYKKRIQSLEDMLINRKNWDIKKCPKFKKRKKKSLQKFS